MKLKLPEEAKRLSIYTGERENLGMSTVDAAQKVLSSTLQYLLQDAATDVVKATK